MLSGLGELTSLRGFKLASAVPGGGLASSKLLSCLKSPKTYIIMHTPYIALMNMVIPNHKPGRARSLYQRGPPAAKEAMMGGALDSRSSVCEGIDNDRRWYESQVCEENDGVRREERLDGNALVNGRNVGLDGEVSR